jgi:hypothetical protein
LAELIQRGIVGTETVVTDSGTRERFLEIGIGDSAPIARQLDLRA